MATVDLTISPAMKVFLIHHCLREAVMEMDAALKAGLLEVADIHACSALEINYQLYAKGLYSSDTYNSIGHDLEYISRAIFNVKFNVIHGIQEV